MIGARIAKLGLRLKLGENADVVNVLSDPRYGEVWKEYYELVKREGVSRAQAMEEMRTRTTLIGAILVGVAMQMRMLCGTVGNYLDHLRYVER